MSEEFFERITAINLRRMSWLIAVFLPVSAGFFAYNVSLHAYPGMIACQVGDLILSPTFLVLAIIAQVRPGPLPWRMTLVLLYYAYCLLSMDWYYFSSLPYFGDSPVYALGVIMPAVLLLVPPSAFFPLILGNHVLYLTLAFLSGRGLNFFLNVSLNGTVGVIIGLLVAWFLYSSKKSEFQKEKVILTRNRELAAANAGMNEIMAIVAHDLRSPLHSLKTLYETASKDPAWVSEPYSMVAGLSTRACGSMLGLVSRLLQAHAAEHRAEAAAFPQNEFIRKRILSCVEQMKTTAGAKGIHLNIELPDEDIEAPVNADVFDETMENLLSNAIKFSPPGSSVTVALLQEGSEWRVEVRDSGPGIPRQDHDRLFSKFFRGTNQATGGEPGTGLGLFIARKLMESMDGSVNYVPGTPCGSIFQIRFAPFRRRS